MGLRIDIEWYIIDELALIGNRTAQGVQLSPDDDGHTPPNQAHGTEVDYDNSVDSQHQQSLVGQNYDRVTEHGLDDQSAAWDTEHCQSSDSDDNSQTGYRGLPGVPCEDPTPYDEYMPCNEESTAQRTRYLIRMKMTEIRTRRAQYRNHMLNLLQELTDGREDGKPSHFDSRVTWCNPCLPNCPGSISAGQFAYDQIWKLRHTSRTTNHVEEEVQYIGRGLFRKEDQSIDNNIPDTMYKIQKMLDVSSHEMYLINVCPTRNCPIWWWHLPDANEHCRDCRHAMCSVCKCPRCGVDRFTKVSDVQGGVWEAAHRAYFFPDAINQFFLNKEWVADVKYCRARKLALYHESPEYRRIIGILNKNKCDVDNAYFFELSADGIPLTPHYSTTVYMIRSKDVSPNMEAKLGNIQPIIVVPGPKEPSCGLEVFTQILLNMFAMYGPRGFEEDEVVVDLQRRVEAGPATNQGVDPGLYNAVDDAEIDWQGTGSALSLESDEWEGQGPLKRSSDTLDVVVPILTGIVADFPMRSKLTHWSGHGGQYNGGWCMCNRQYTPPGMSTDIKIDGYSQPVPQPYLLELKHGWIRDPAIRLDRAAPCTRIGHPSLKLTPAVMKSRGELTVALQGAIHKYRATGSDKSVLNHMGYYNLSEVEDRLQSMGRTHTLPWATDVMIRDLPYVSIGDLCLVPVAHLFLHGLMKSFLTHCFKRDDKWKAGQCILTNDMKSSLRVTWKNTLYPIGCLGTPRNPIDHIQSYKMQDMAALLWTGALICVHAPVGFAKLWKPLRDSATHYLYGYSANEEDMDIGESRLQEYAQLLELSVLKGHAPSSLLRPNLHIAHCRLRDQERATGPAARNNELWMERGLQACTRHGEGRGKEHPDTTWVKRVPILDRALGAAEELWGFSEWERKVGNTEQRTSGKVRSTTDPDRKRGVYPVLKSGVKAFSKRSQHCFKWERRTAYIKCMRPPTTTNPAWHFNNRRLLAAHSLWFLVQRDSTFTNLYNHLTESNWDPCEIHKYCQLKVFCTCAFANKQFSSLLAVDTMHHPQRALASAFATLHRHPNTRTASQGESACHRQFGEPHVIDHYILTTWSQGPEAPTHVSKFAVCCGLNALPKTLLGQAIWQVTEPHDISWDTNGKLVPVVDLDRPLIVVKPHEIRDRDTFRNKWTLLAFRSSNLDAGRQIRQHEHERRDGLQL